MRRSAALEFEGYSDAVAAAANLQLWRLGGMHVLEVLLAGFLTWPKLHKTGSSRSATRQVGYLCLQCLQAYGHTFSQ